MAGVVVANALDLNDGPFDYVTSGITEDEMACSQGIVERRREEVVEMDRRKEGGGASEFPTILSASVTKAKDVCHRSAQTTSRDNCGKRAGAMYRRHVTAT